MNVVKFQVLGVILIFLSVHSRVATYIVCDICQWLTVRGNTHDLPVMWALMVRVNTAMISNSHRLSRLGSHSTYCKSANTQPIRKCHRSYVYYLNWTTCDHQSHLVRWWVPVFWQNSARGLSNWNSSANFEMLNFRTCNPLVTTEDLWCENCVSFWA